MAICERQKVVLPEELLECERCGALIAGASRKQDNSPPDLCAACVVKKARDETPCRRR
jgi:hypothetical protein